MSEESEEDAILDGYAVAKILKVHYRTVIRRADSGELPAFRVGDLWRFRRRDLEAYIDRQIRERSQNRENE